MRWTWPGKIQFAHGCILIFEGLATWENTPLCIIALTSAVNWRTPSHTTPARHGIAGANVKRYNGDVMETSEPTTPRWAARFKQHCHNVHRSPQDDTARSSRQEIWQILYFMLSRYIQYHTARLGSVAPEDIEDIASQKSLELGHSIDTRSGSLNSLEVSEIPGFLSTVARNGLVDLLKTRGRYASPRNDEDLEMHENTHRLQKPVEQPDVRVERTEFAAALRQCAEALDPRMRLIWFFKVFYDMRSSEIAAHPKVNLKPSHVDVVANRGRNAVRNCMKRKGFRPEDMPRGTFVELWTMFHPVAAESKEAR